MEKSRELNEFECGKIISLRIAGRTHKAIAHLLKIPQSTVTQHANSNNGSNAKRTRRTLSMNNDDHQTLKKIIKNNRSSLNEIHHNFWNLKNRKVLQDTIRKTFHQMEIHLQIAVPKPLLTKSQCENRLKWYMEWQNWSIQKWKTVIWSDESQFTLFENDGLVMSGEKMVHDMILKI